METITIINRLEKIKLKKDTIDDLIRDLKMDEISKPKKGKFNPTKLFKDMIKRNVGIRPGFAGTYKINGKWQLCDGYKLIEWKNESEVAEAMQLVGEYSINVCYDSVKPKNTSTFRKVEIDINVLEKIVRHNKVNKLKGTDAMIYIDKFNDNNEIGINAEWLLDLLKLNNTNIVTYTETNYAPILINSDEYNCMVLPIRINDENEYQKAKNKMNRELIEEFKK